MRKYLFIAAFLSYFSVLRGQSSTYHPLPSDSLVWLELACYDHAVFYYLKVMRGDTTIFGNDYKKLYSYSLGTSPSHPTPISLQYIGAIRQDIPNKRIYEIDYSGTEKLLYDFNKVLGDTMFTGSGYTLDTLYVNSIDSVLVGTEYHKRFNFKNTDSLELFPSSLIEGVGNQAGFGNLYDGGFETCNMLDCFSHNGRKIYPSTIYQGGCFTFVGIENLGQDSFKISLMPNPTQDELHLIINCGQNYNVQITNETGQLLIQKNNQSVTKLTFNLNDYPNGIYFLRLSDQEGNSVTKKIIKN